MILEAKIKKAALMAAVDISFRRMKKSPDRCARNLMELGLSTYPNKISKNQRDDFLQKLLVFCKNSDTKGARELFIHMFFQE